jgi:hypothetical protein
MNDLTEAATLVLCGSLLAGASSLCALSFLMRNERPFQRQDAGTNRSKLLALLQAESSVLSDLAIALVGHTGQGKSTTAFFDGFIRSDTTTRAYSSMFFKVKDFGSVAHFLVSIELDLTYGGLKVRYSEINVDNTSETERVHAVTMIEWTALVASLTRLESEHPLTTIRDGLGWSKRMEGSKKRRQKKLAAPQED